MEINDTADVGLELSSSRGSSYQDLTEIAASQPPPQIQPSPPRRQAIPRPPSYSDSFLVLSPQPLLTGSLNFGQVPLLEPIEQAQPQEQADEQAHTSTTLTKIMSVGTHITLIGIFETVFYFEFISKSEDGGIQATINQFLQGTLSQCASWPANTTAVLADLLALAVNETAVAAAADQAAAARAAANNQLEIQAWMYAVALASTLLVGGLIARSRGHLIRWREVIVDNIILVTLLGAYEAFFFKTIIYNYQSLSLPELERSILQQLGATCGI